MKLSDERARMRALTVLLNNPSEAERVAAEIIVRLTDDPPRRLQFIEASQPRERAR